MLINSNLSGHIVSISEKALQGSLDGIAKNPETRAAMLMRLEWIEKEAYEQKVIQSLFSFDIAEFINHSPAVHFSFLRHRDRVAKERILLTRSRREQFKEDGIYMTENKYETYRTTPDTCAKTIENPVMQQDLEKLIPRLEQNDASKTKAILQESDRILICFGFRGEKNERSINAIENFIGENYADKIIKFEDNTLSTGLYGSTFDAKCSNAVLKKISFR